MDALRRMAPRPGRRASEPIVLGYVTVIRIKDDSSGEPSLASDK